MLITKNKIPNKVVARVKKFPLPEEPNKVADAPEPKDEPMSAPLPRCIKTNATITIAITR
ncbi:hypothetical protein GAPWKB30_1977 [Gilliamella apicola]|nr:hypothetical protein GAPWKB30_1977 [Gilliamella apicola]